MIEIGKVLKDVSSIDASVSSKVVKGLTNNSSEVKEGFIFFAFKYMSVMYKGCTLLV